jgi:hypothetical protein
MFLTYKEHKGSAAPLHVLHHAASPQPAFVKSKLSSISLSRLCLFMTRDPSCFKCKLGPQNLSICIKFSSIRPTTSGCPQNFYVLPVQKKLILCACSFFLLVEAYDGFSNMPIWSLVTATVVQVMKLNICFRLCDKNPVIFTKKHTFHQVASK